MGDKRHLEAGAQEKLLKEELREGDAQRGSVGKALPQQPAGPAVLLLTLGAPDQARVEPQAPGALASQEERWALCISAADAWLCNAF